MKLMKLNVIALACFTVMGLASFDAYAGCGKCGGEAGHKHEVKSEAKEACAKDGKTCSMKKKKACCGSEKCKVANKDCGSCEAKEACTKDKACAKDKAEKSE